MSSISCKYCSSLLQEGSKFCESCGKLVPPQEKTDPLLGRTLLNQYIVRSKLGEGGFGAVYIADQPSMGRKVAIKALHRHLCHEPSVAARFRREGIAAAKLTHRSAVQMLNVGETEDGILWMAMEYLEGETLDARVRKQGPLSPEDLVTVMSQVCEVLHEAHEKGIVHRDMKPENIMLTYVGKGEILSKVLDFGIAGLLDESSSITKTNFVMGTPQYMSPEHWKSAKDTDRRSDIYSLGVIAYQALTARLPFEADTTYGWMSKHCAEAPLSLRDYAPNVPQALQDVILRCLSKAPEDRYQDTIQLKEVLEASLDNKTLHPSVKPESPQKTTPTNHTLQTTQTTQPAQSKTPLLIGGILALVVGAGLVAVLLPKNKPATTQPQTTTQPEAASTQKTTNQIDISKVAVPSNMVLFAGSKMMLGSDNIQNNNPRHEVTIAPFLIDKQEVSVAEYLACVEAKGCIAPEEHETEKDYPMNNVTFAQAQAFCAWRASKDKVATKLPSEDEWEFAARDGKDQLYPWGGLWEPANSIHAIGRAEPDYTQPVGTKMPSSAPEKPQHLIGNVAEWVTTTNLGSLTNCGSDCQIIRGGSYISTSPNELSAPHRAAQKATQGALHIGFRCAASL